MELIELVRDLVLILAGGAAIVASIRVIRVAHKVEAIADSIAQRFQAVGDLGKAVVSVAKEILPGARTATATVGLVGSLRRLFSRQKAG